MSRTLCAAAALLLAAMRISAHHAFASEYDEKKLVKVSGAATRVHMDQSPRLAVLGRKGCKRQHHIVEHRNGKPQRPCEQGMEAVGPQEGDRVTVEGYGSKTAGSTANAATITLPDGRKLFGGFQSTPRIPHPNAVP